MSRIDGLYSCDICKKSQDDVLKIFSRNEDHDAAICNECVEESAKLLVDEGISEGLYRIERSIEFSPEYRQAGISILSYFVEVLAQNYPDVEALVRIEQLENKVKMVIEGPSGSRKIIERELEKYGQVIEGRLKAEDVLSDKIQVMALNNKLEIAAMELRHNKELLKFSREESSSRTKTLETQVDELQKLIGKSLLSVNKLASHINSVNKNVSQNEVVAKALDVIYSTIEKGESDETQEVVKEQLMTIKEHDPRVFESIKTFVGGTLAGLTGNVAYQWLLPIINSMPK